MRDLRVDIASPDLVRRLAATSGLVSADSFDDHDFCFVSGFGPDPGAVMFARPMMYVHSFSILPLPPTSRVLLSVALTSYAQGWARHRPLSPVGCLFQVSPGNSTMEAFASTLGGHPEPGVIHRIDHL
jgi:hypothetical protein